MKKHAKKPNKQKQTNVKQEGALRIIDNTVPN